MIFLFDTNIVLLYLRKLAVINIIEAVYNPFGLNNTATVSVVTVGELKALALNNKWGKSKIREMEDILLDFLIVDINTEEIINRYAEIDAFSQGRLEGRKLNISARNMGKNDIWIAATASVLDATLLTTDKDFNHLDGEFLQVGKIDIRN